MILRVEIVYSSRELERRLVCIVELRLSMLLGDADDDFLFSIPKHAAHHNIYITDSFSAGTQ